MDSWACMRRSLYGEFGRRARWNPDRRHFQPVRRGPAGRAPAEPASRLPRVATERTLLAGRRSCRVPRRPCLGHSLHLGAPADGFRPGGAVGRRRPPRARRARPGRECPPVEHRAHTPGNGAQQPAADEGRGGAGEPLRRAARPRPADDCGGTRRGASPWRAVRPPSCPRWGHGLLVRARRTPPAGDYGSSQFSTLSPGTRAKWRTLPVTSVSSRASAMDAIRRSGSSRRRPSRSSSARSRP